MRLDQADRIMLGASAMSRMQWGANQVWSAAPAVDMVFDGRPLSGPITFARASTATNYDQAGVRATAQIDEPRFFHDPISGEFRGLLIEEQRTNYVPNSEHSGLSDVTGKPTQSGAGIASDYRYTTDEFGFRVLEYVIYGTATASGLTTEALVSFAVQNGVKIAQSARMSRNTYLGGIAEGNNFWGADRNQIGEARPWLIAGADPLPIQLLTRTAIPDSTGNGLWYHRLNFRPGNTFQLGFSIAARQVEYGDYATSYIPTTGAVRTRAADTAVLDPQGWLHAEKGTFWLVHDVPVGRPLLGNDTAAVLLSVGPGRTAFRYGPEGAIVVHNGAAPLSVEFPAFAASLQMLGAGAARANAAISRLTYYPRRLTVEQMQEATL